MAIHNKYEGKCTKCGRVVAPGDGFAKANTPLGTKPTWLVTHVSCPNASSTATFRGADSKPVSVPIKNVKIDISQGETKSISPHVSNFTALKFTTIPEFNSNDILGWPAFKDAALTLGWFSILTRIVASNAHAGVQLKISSLAFPRINTWECPLTTPSLSEIVSGAESEELTAMFREARTFMMCWVPPIQKEA